MDLKDYGLKYLTRIRYNPLSVNEVAFVEVLIQLLKRINNDQDAIVLLTGERGKGKTSLAINSAISLVAMPSIDFFAGAPQMEFSWENLITKYDGETVKKISTKEKNIFVFDEFSDVGFSGDALNRKTKFFSKLFTKTRKLNSIYFICTPFFSRLTGFFRETAHFWIHVVHRQKNERRDDSYATAYIFKKIDDPTIPDPWLLSVAASDIKKTNDEVLRKLQSMRTFKGEIQYRPMYKEMEDFYKNISKKALGETEYDFEKPPIINPAKV